MSTGVVQHVHFDVPWLMMMTTTSPSMSRKLNIKILTLKTIEYHVKEAGFSAGIG